AGIAVVAYTDQAEGTMELGAGTGRFTEVRLHHTVTVAPGTPIARAEALHAEAHAVCFIANSVNFPVRHAPTTLEA
ncbi:MAG: OsmC family peroxiredoxin, partial [Candidatus Sericytochromatia bacterium]